MGRYKLSANGGYYDPNDSGPDQFTPTPGQQVPGMPAPQQAQTMPQTSGVPTTPGVNGQPVYTGGYDPNGPMYGKPGWGGGTGEAPDYNALYPSVPGQGGRLIKGGGESSWVSDESLAESQRLANEYARTGVMPEMPKAPWPWVGQQNQAGGIWDAIQKQQGGGYKPLSALGGIFGQGGGNVAPKPSGGIMGAVFNKYPGLFTK